jgi:hypothetical protein
MNTLNSHPDIDLRGELYNPSDFPEVLGFHNAQKNDFRRCIDYLENRLAAPAPGSLTRKNKRYLGLKILTNQLFFISADFPAYFMERYKDAFFMELLCRIPRGLPRGGMHAAPRGL